MKNLRRRWERQDAKKITVMSRMMKTTAGPTLLPEEGEAGSGGGGGVGAWDDCDGEESLWMKASGEE